MKSYVIGIRTVLRKQFFLLLGILSTFKKVKDKIIIVNDAKRSFSDIEKKFVEMLKKKNWIVEIIDVKKQIAGNALMILTRKILKENKTYGVFLDDDVVLTEESILTCVKYMKENDYDMVSVLGDELNTERMEEIKKSIEKIKVLDPFFTVLDIEKVRPMVTLENFDSIKQLDGFKEWLYWGKIFKDSKVKYDVLFLNEVYHLTSKNKYNPWWNISISQVCNFIENVYGG